MASEPVDGGQPAFRTMTADSPVVIVGAGATGLTTALRLASHGVPSLVLDRYALDAGGQESRRSGRPGSSGAVVPAGVIRIWDGLDPDIGRWLRSTGDPQHRHEIHWGRRTLHGRDVQSLGRDDLGSVALPYPSVRAALLGAARRQALVDVRLGTRVLGMIPGPLDVTLLVDAGALNTSWVVAADGALSTLRLSLGISRSSVSLPHVLVTLEVQGDDSFSGLGPATVSWFAPPSDRAGHLLVTPQPNRRWRLDWTHPRTVDLETEERSGRLRERLAALMGPQGWSTSAATIRRVDHHLADAYRRGRVLLAGDAAHRVTAPGDTGLAIGVHDAVTAADAVATALREPGSAERVLGQYAAERRGTALEVGGGRLRAIRRRVPDTATRRCARAAALVTAPWFPTARRYLEDPFAEAALDRPSDGGGITATVPAPSTPPDDTARQREHA